VTSDGKGKGSTFRVTLPLMIQLEADVRARVGARASASAAHVTVPDLRGVHVLAVDDDRDALRLVTEILEAAGARVTAAASAMEALSILETNAPDVLVTDVAMPQMDGFALLAQVRQSQDPAIRDVPAAALTAYARSEDRQKALRNGFQVHLAKPIDPGELMGAVATLVNRAFQATRP
jgi:CheY-like chemotaxis protein